jgi:hypothetical protein
MIGPLLSRAAGSVAEALDHTVGWHRLPSVLGIPTLFAVRDKLRRLNVYDEGEYRPPLEAPPGEWERYRSIDGTYNDLGAPRMGSVGSRFGRNVPPACARPEEAPGILIPDPFEVSDRLLARDTFRPAGLNVLAAAWIQLEVHDWFDHGTPELSDVPWDPARPDWPGRDMAVKRTRKAPTGCPGGVPGVGTKFTSEDTHWWDGSQLYGRDERWLGAVRDDGGRLKTPDQLIGGLGDLVDPAGSAANLWVGPLALSGLLVLEHNAICDALVKGEGRRWHPDELFHTARLVNAALMAKIHWLDWSIAVLHHPALTRGLRMNWYGALEQITKRLGRVGGSDFLFGIPGSATEHHGVPYSLTEEFVAVYRMHWLMPDDFTFHRAAGRSTPLHFGLLDLTGPTNAPAAMKQIGGLDDVLWSLAIAPAGAPGLHNYPTSLRNLVRPTGPDGAEERIDLAAIDILRDRERGLPRYNLFRRLFHLPPISSFEQLTPNRGWAEQIRDMYEGDIDRVDLQIGLLVEPPPRGFAVSDTAFRVFLLMASRRLKCDRFFTSCYNAGTYTRTGMEWIKANDMKSVLVRHYPHLEPALRRVGNPFFPWPG